MGYKKLKTALVAGAAGFIGSHLSERLLNEGFNVIGYDNFLTGFQNNIDDLLNNPRFLFREVDISKDVNIPEVKIDVIFHFASPASPLKYFAAPHETINANVAGTSNLLELAKANQARFIFASTSEIYGDPLISPQPESYWGNVNPIGPRSIYDEAKRMGETLCALYRREGVNAGIIRIFNTYGPKMDPYDGRVVSTFIRQAIRNEPFSVYGTGDQTRSFCYITDLVEGILLFSNKDLLGPINLGNQIEIKVIDLAIKISQLLNVVPRFDFMDSMEDDPKQRKPEILVAKTELNWSPKVDIEEGVMKTADWMRKTLN